MIGLKKRPAPGEYVVPNNSALNLQHKTGIYDPKPNSMEKTVGGQGATNKCRYCENMAKNFLYLESLIRNNGGATKGATGQKSCNLCNSSLKYLEYVNRNIRQVFGNFDSIVQADRALASKPAMLPKYSVAPPSPPPERLDLRAKGGAVLSTQRSARSLKTKSKSIASAKTKVKGKAVSKGLKGQKSSKSLKSLKSKKSLKTLKSHKSLKSTKSSKSQKTAKSSSLRKGLPKSKGSGLKSQISHGKMILKRKFRAKAGSGKMVRSVSQYHNLGPVRSKISKGGSQKRLIKMRSERPPPPSINWKLLKRNLPKRPAPVK
ncbi:hypothetical protein KR009_004376 [Drosophila setifemur]|nr:hypothetical protein KR009_004376 [Drosophila setifemur]